MKTFTLLILFFVFTAHAEVIPGARCANHTINNVKFDYCIYPSSDLTNKDLVIHLHGLGGNEKAWQNQDRHIATRRELRLVGKSIPTVATLSLGALWLLTEVKDRGNYYNLVKNKIFPFLAEQANFHKDGRMILMGESMGGFNALQFYLKNPELFDRYIIMCPAVSQLKPWATKTEIDDFIKRTNASRLRVEFYMNVAKSNFRNPAEWASHDPLQLAQTHSENLPPLYLSGDELDQYGFYEGDMILNTLLFGKPSEHRWSSVNGTHCEVDSKDIAAFF